MNEWIYYDIPRIFTAAAQWGACMVYVLILKKRFGRIKTMLLSLPFLILQCVLLLSTENLSPIWWIPVLAAAAALMWIMLAALCRNGKKELGYAALCAFLSAETRCGAGMAYPLLCGIYRRPGYACGQDRSSNPVIWDFFIIVWMAERKLLDRVNGFRVTGKEIYVTLGIILFVFLMSNLSYAFPDTPFSSRLFYEVFRIRAFIDIMGMFVLFIYQLQIREKLEMIEMNSISQVLRSQYEKYLYQQKSSELISIKYHDLKHQIAALRKESDQKKREEWLDSIENEIDSYRMGADTGNSVLDAVIEDKMLSIRKHNIEFTYVVNGRLLEFMHVTDICSIFGNGLDNAIEAEILEQDEDKRIIHLTVAAKRKMVCITMENYISHPEKISSDRLETTKSNADYHGYGIKSIRYCADKYHGNLTVGTNGNWFVLNIIIPQR